MRRAVPKRVNFGYSTTNLRGIIYIYIYTKGFWGPTPPPCCIRRSFPSQIDNNKPHRTHTIIYTSYLVYLIIHCIYICIYTSTNTTAAAAALLLLFVWCIMNQREIEFSVNNDRCVPLLLLLSFVSRPFAGHTYNNVFKYVNVCVCVYFEAYIISVYHPAGLIETCRVPKRNHHHHHHRQRYPALWVNHTIDYRNYITITTTMMIISGAWEKR